MKLSSNVVGNSNDENNFLHKLLLTNTQNSKLSKAFATGSLADIKLSKIQLHKTGQGFFGKLLGPLLKTGLPLIENLPKQLAESVLISLGLTAAASTTDAAINKKMFVSDATTLVTSNDEMNDIMKIVKSLEESCSLKKGVSETIKSEVKNKKEGFSVCYKVKNNWKRNN